MQGFGDGNAAFGFIFGGPVGLLSGGIGEGKDYLSCRTCGYQWDNKGTAAKMDIELQKQEILGCRGRKRI